MNVQDVVNLLLNGLTGVADTFSGRVQKLCCIHREILLYFDKFVPLLAVAHEMPHQKAHESKGFQEGPQLLFRHSLFKTRKQYLGSKEEFHKTVNQIARHEIDHQNHQNKVTETLFRERN